MRSQKYSFEAGVRCCFSSDRKRGKSDSEARFPIERIVSNLELVGTLGHSVICIAAGGICVERFSLGKRRREFPTRSKIKSCTIFWYSNFSMNTLSILVRLRVNSLFVGSNFSTNGAENVG